MTTSLRAIAFCLPLTIAVYLCGCPRPTDQGAQPADVTPPPQATDAVKLSLWTIWNAEPRQSALQQMVDAFEQQNPGVDIEITTLEPDAYKTRIRVALGGNTPPDIYFVWSGEKMLHAFIRGGNIADITSYMDADSGAWRQRMVSASLDNFTYDGRVYGIPYLLQCTFFFYNKNMFEKHGWQVPQTYDELMSLCETIKSTGITPIALGNVQKWPAHHFPFVFTQRLLGREAMEKQFDPLGPGEYAEPEWTRGLEMLADWSKRGFFNDSPNGTTRENARALFYSQKAAMFYTGTWDLARFSEGGEAPEEFIDAWDFFNFPSIEGGKGDQQALAGSPDGYVISASSPHIEQAAAFLQFMTTLEQAQTFVTKCQELVEVKGAVTEEIAGARLAKYAQIVEAAQTIAPWMDTMCEGTVAEEYMNGVQALLDGSMSPEEVMKNTRARQAKAKQEILAAEKQANPVPEGSSN